MLEVDQSYKLIFKMNNEKSIVIDEQLLEKLENGDKSSLPNNTVVHENLAFFHIIFDNNIKIKIFRYPVECKFIDMEASIKIFAYEHFKAILEKKLKENIYHYPYFYSQLSYEMIYIDMNKIDDLSINCYKYIEIKNKDIKELRAKTKLIFTSLNSLYSKNKDESLLDITYNGISPNFKYYYPKLKIELTDQFNIIPGQSRLEFGYKMKKFLQNKTTYIYPLCGPHGTGKSITALYIHKKLYSDEIKGLYLNLKYYSQKYIKLDNIIDVLLNECFFICDNEGELIDLYKKFLLKKNFLELMEIIGGHIRVKNNGKKENDIKIYIIMDQYQKKYNMDNLFNYFSGIKIILLSSINDFDVKNNIILSYEEDIKKDFNNENNINDKSVIVNIIKYNYIDSFISNDYYKKGKYKELIRNKIRNNIKNKKKRNNINNVKEENNEIDGGYKNELLENEKNKKEKMIEEGNGKDDIIEEKEEEIEKYKKDEIDEKTVEEEYNFIIKILKKFDFICKYFFEYLYYYDSIHDLLFNEYSNIMKKLNDFKKKGIINIDKLSYLINQKNIEKKDNIINASTLEIIDFIKCINIIPLKYINFKKCDNGRFFLYYSFPLLKKIFKEFIMYHESNKLFYISDNKSDRGNYFERILKYKCRVDKKLEIDGYFEVNQLIKMDPTKKYSKINLEYISSKNNIFIDQKDDQGPKYDFAIYKPKDKQLFLFQSKYIINDNTVDKKKSLFEETANNALESFNKLFNETVGEVYLLYISSIYYNYDKGEEIFKILSRNRINSIFYSLKLDEFYYNFDENIKTIECDNSYMLIPTSEYYSDQKFFNNINFELEEGIYHKYDKNERNNKKKEVKIDTIDYLLHEEENKGRLFLQKKTYRENNDLYDIYKEILSYIKSKSTFNNEKIINLLGSIKEIKSYEFITTWDKIDEYAFLFYLKNTEILKLDDKQKIGLIIYDNGVDYYVNLKENKNYESFDDLLKTFSYGAFFAIGKKK